MEPVNYRVILESKMKTNRENSEARALEASQQKFSAVSEQREYRQILEIG